MSGELLQRLYEEQAFKPAPSLWELAETHVPFDELGMGLAPEPRLRNGLVEGDGLALLVGRSGGGKSSVMAYLASQLAGETTSDDPPRRYLPVFVPVAARPDVADDLTGFAKGAIEAVLLALRDGLPREYREKLERGRGQQLSLQKVGPKFNAKLAARIFGSGGEAGIELGGDVTSIIGRPDLDNRGGLRTLGDIVRARGFELILLVEDTDAWARGAGAEPAARRFFTSVLRPASTEVDIGIGVAVQQTWEGSGGYAEVRERAVSSTEMPAPSSRAEAASVLRTILERRAARVLGDGVPYDAVVTDGGLEVLAAELMRRASMRAPLARVRDTLDRFADALPDRLDREHLMESY